MAIEASHILYGAIDRTASEYYIRQLLLNRGLSILPVGIVKEVIDDLSLDQVQLCILQDLYGGFNVDEIQTRTTLPRHQIVGGRDLLLEQFAKQSAVRDFILN